jgi:spermidine/putrescine transport system substrate-binding protein
MMRRGVLLLAVMALAALFALPVVAQDGEGWVCPTGFEGQTLSVFNWGTYISDEDDTATDFNENLVQGFEELCGVTVIYDGTMENSEQFYNRMLTGNPGWDLAAPTDYLIPVLIEEGLIIPFNPDNIPNLANMKANLANPWYDEEGIYAVPYFWGTIAIGYNAAVVEEEVTSWMQLFEYDGPVAWLEDRRAMMGVALTLLGFDPNTANEDEINAARDFLLANSENVISIAQDDGQVLLARGDVDMVIEYNGDVFQVAAECAESASCTSEFVYTVPEEGTNRWVDNMVIPVDAPNPALAEVFLDYLYDPQVAGVNANFVQYGSPNQAAVDAGFILEELLANPGIYPTEEIDANLYGLRDLTLDVQDIFDAAWEDIKLGIGQ